MKRNKKAPKTLKEFGKFFDKQDDSKWTCGSSNCAMTILTKTFEPGVSWHESNISKQFGKLLYYAGAAKNAVVRIYQINDADSVNYMFPSEAPTHLLGDTPKERIMNAIIPKIALGKDF